MQARFSLEYDIVTAFCRLALRNMKMVKELVLVSVLVLSGCATTNPRIAELSNEALQERLQSSVVVVRPVAQPAKLVERTKSQAVGNFLLSSLVSSAMMTDTGARTPAEFHNNMKIGQEFGQNLNAALPTGRETDAGQGVDRYLVDRLTARFPTPDPIPAAGLIELIVSQLQWELAYESFLGSSAYSLSSSVEVRAVEAGGSSPVTLRSHRCSEKAQETHSLDEWHADDNAAIRHVADALAEKCFRTTLMALGIE